MQLRIPLLPAHPLINPLVAFALLTLALYSLLAHWEHHSGGRPHFPNATRDHQAHFEVSVGHDNHKVAGGAQGVMNPSTDKPGTSQGADNNAMVATPNPPAGRRVVAHFMLGNTYPFTHDDWERTLDHAEEIGLDALVLNLGSEDWQVQQAHVAYDLASKRIRDHKHKRRHVKFFFSIDMDVLPSDTPGDATKLVTILKPFLLSPAALWRGQQPILSTFAGNNVAFGNLGWTGFLDELNRELPREVFFWPAFFLPPTTYTGLPFVDGTFAWNCAWPEGNNSIEINRGEVELLLSPKPYMASVSPLFFTHYGKVGQWAFDKNFIYRSDDLLYPSRWQQLMDLTPQHSPEMVQVVSWNDYGESNYIAPFAGAQPGSDAWTHRMGHSAFFEMTKYFTSRWRDGAPEASHDIVVWMWYRPTSKFVVVEQDKVGPPANAGWAVDLINIVTVIPHGVKNPEIRITNGPNNATVQATPVKEGRMTTLGVPFVPGQVVVELVSDRGVHLRESGRHIQESNYIYNFNMWSGAWHAHPLVVLEEGGP